MSMPEVKRDNALKAIHGPACAVVLKCSLDRLEAYTRTLQQERDILKERLEKAEELMDQWDQHFGNHSMYLNRATADFLKGGE